MTYSIIELVNVIPTLHWVVMGLLSLLVVALLLALRRTSAYGAVALGIAVFTALLMLEVTVAIRLFGLIENGTGVRLDFDFRRLLHVRQLGYESLFNIVAFAPYAFFVSEYLAEAKRLGPWGRLGLGTLATLGLSLFIECLQLVLKAGFFELTDLILNTIGGFLGALLSVLLRAIFKSAGVRR